MTGEAINPFVVPHFETSLMKPLRPFHHADHRDLYVPVDDCMAQFRRFTEHVAQLPMPPEEGQLILVTGDTGCGKSALVNRCADYLATRLEESHVSIKCPIIDVTSVLETERQLQIMDRMEAVRDEVLDELRMRDLVIEERLAELVRNPVPPARTYRTLSRCLHDRSAMIILLPDSDLPEELINYAKAIHPGIFFFAESAYLEENDTNRIVRDVEDWTTPLHLRVGRLAPGDVARFVEDRLTRNTQRGRYPRMSDETTGEIESKFGSIGQLQRTLQDCYQHRLDHHISYDDDDWITVSDIKTADRTGAVS